MIIKMIQLHKIMKTVGRVDAGYTPLAIITLKQFYDILKELSLKTVLSPPILIYLKNI